MTTPSEELQALLGMRRLAIDLLDSRKTPKIPKKIRLRASQCLRHFPYIYKVESKWQNDIEAYDLGVKK